MSSSRAAAPAPPLPAVPDHELIRCIGRGSYGEVWLARHARLGALRAVKVVRRDQFDDARPFQREFDGICRYEPISRGHPNLVAILHVGGTDDCFFYVMELADATNGGCPMPNVELPATPPAESSHSSLEIRYSEMYSPHTLRSELKRHGALPIERCLEIGLALAGALTHLHARGLVHRDVKPSNVIFVGGVAKLADIGLVAAVSDSRSFVGTEGYIPPEGPGTPSADCYALGKLLYELSTGHDRIAWPEPPADLPTRPDRERLLELNAILHKACAPDARARYPNAETMQADLELLQRGSSVRRRQALQRCWTAAGRTAAAAVLLTALLAGGWLLSQRFDASFRPVAVEVDSIAVLPFVGQNIRNPHRYLTDALTEESINALTNCAGLRVASRAAVFGFKGTNADPRHVGEQFAVRTVLAGTLKNTGNQLQVAAKLIRVDDGSVLWSASFDREVGDIGAIQSELVRQVTRQLELQIDDRLLRRLETNLVRKLRAYQIYNQAFGRPRNTKDGINKNIELLNRAIVEDPNFAAAYADLAQCYEQSAGFLLPPAQAFLEAKKNALRALALDDSLPKAHMALASAFFNLDLNYPGAEAAFRRAIETAPRYGGAYASYAHLLSFLGRFDEAEQQLKQGEQVDPKSQMVLGTWCWRYYLNRRFEDSVRQATRLLTLHTNDAVGLMLLGWAHERLGHYEKAVSAHEN